MCPHNTAATWTKQARPRLTMTGSCLLANGWTVSVWRTLFINFRQEQVWPIPLEKARFSRKTYWNKLTNQETPLTDHSIQWSVLFHEALWKTKLWPQGTVHFTLYTQTRKNILNVSPGNIRSNIIHDPLEIHGRQSWPPPPPNWDKVGNLRLNEVKSGLEVSCHCQGPFHHTSRRVKRESLTQRSLPSFKREIIFNWAKSTYLLIRYHVPTPSIYWTSECPLGNWYGSGHERETRNTRWQKAYSFSWKLKWELGQN